MVFQQGLESFHMAKTQTYRLLLVRTGSTEWDDAGRLQGTVDLPLSVSARQGMGGKLDELGSAELSVVLSGPDEASRQTAEALAAKAGCPVRVVDEFQEVNLGLWEGMLVSEFERRYPRVCRQWQEDPASVMAPEGENLEEARDRVLGALMRELERSKKGGAVAAVMRPIVWGVVHCSLRRASTCEFWTGTKEAGWFEWFSVPRSLGRTAAPAAWAK
jgi:probable phosphoglycerate mutase